MLSAQIWTRLLTRILASPKPDKLGIMISVIAICVGACLGALLRWGLGLWLSTGGIIPYGTLAANLIGGYLVGGCVAVFQAMPQLDPTWRLFLVTGFLGALTTFSSFSAEVVGFMQQARYGLAIGTATIHLFGSLLLTLAGIKTVELILSR
jgi:fluoride exporter